MNTEAQHADTSPPAFDLQSMSDEEIFARQKAAAEHIEGLEADLRDKEAAASKAVEAFAASPNAQTLTDREVAAQRVINARKALDAFNAEIQPLVSQVGRRRSMARLAGLREATNFMPEVNAAIARIVELYADFQASVGTELEIIGRAIERNNDAYEERNKLESIYGSGGDRLASRASIARVLELARDALAQRFGTGFEHDVDHGAHLGIAIPGRAWWVNASMKFKPKLNLNKIG